MTTLIATSVVRGSQQGESHGGVYLIDFVKQQIQQPLDWNTMDIDWQGRGWDRGLRGITFHNDTVFIAASDELFAYSPSFQLKASWKNAYLKHAHEIFCFKDKVYISSTGFDSILTFDIASETFDWGLHIETDGFRFKASAFNPMSEQGPLMLNQLHLNNVFCNEDGLYCSGLKSGGLLHFNGESVNMSATLPQGTHNARPYKNGVIFNDTAADVLRYASRNADEDRVFKVPMPSKQGLVGLDKDQTELARVGFGRGLCEVADGIFAAGSSPSTVSLHDLNQNITGASVMISNDVRNAIHGLEVWPF